MKNIGIFTHDLYPFKPWGQGRYVYDLANELKSKYEGKVHVFSPSENIREEWHVQIFPGSHNTLGKNISFSAKLAFVIEKLIKRYGLGIVHFQGGPGGLFVLKETSVPLIYTVHHTYYQQYKSVRSQGWKKLLYAWEKSGYRKSDFLICDSDSTRNIILRNYRIDPKYCETIPIGVNRERFFPLDVPKIPNSLFFLGRLESRKGIDFLIKSIPRVKEAISDVRLYVGGNGILKPCLEDFVKKNRLEENINFIGAIDDSELNEWFNKMSVIIVPSVFEGFGLTAIEAMASETPVIATDVDGLRDVVEDGINGLLVPYNDIRAMSDRIIYLLSNEEVRLKLNINGRKKALDVYNWGKISQSVLKVYKRFIENQKT